MTSNTLDRFRPFAKFCADRHFIYITACRDEHKEEIQSYYKLIKEDMEEIIKEWPEELLVLVNHVELYDPDLIGSPVVTCEEYDAPNSSRKKKKEDVQEIQSTSEETASDSPSGGDVEVDKEEKEGEEYKHKQDKVTPPQNPLDDTDKYNKRKVSQQNLHCGRIPKIVRRSCRLCSRSMTLTSLSQLYQMPQKIFFIEMKQNKKPCMKELK
jgi:hypothetical protein